MDNDITPTDNTIYNRHAARFIAILSLYSCNLNNDQPKNLVKISQKMTASYLTKDVFDLELNPAQLEEIKLFTPDEIFLESLLNLTYKQEPEAEKLIRNSLNTKWNYERLDQVIQTILKLAGIELLFHNETPTNIIIDEYVGLTKTFYENNEAGFVNKVLQIMSEKARKDLKETIA